MKCKWEQDEFCVNADCPCCADWCPVFEISGVCRYEDRGNRTNADKIRAANHEQQMANIVFQLLKKAEGYTDSRLGFVLLLQKEAEE